MVQRNTPDKLGIQASCKNYCVKSSSSEKMYKAVKQVSSQESDIRNKGGGGSELKKMMKKSRSIKRSELVNLGSSLARRTKAQSNKIPSPAAAAPVAVSTPKKQSPQSAQVVASTPKKPSPQTNRIPLAEVAPTADSTPKKPTSVKLPDASKPTPLKLPDASPNYMKSTACSSNARRERSQVTPQSSRTGCDSKSPCSKDRKLSSESSHKSGRTLTKTSSLKPVRTLTKTGSNKAGRPSMKKKSGVSLYPDQNVERATCSSTLKDSKFPSYVMLHPGGTESEGTSVMKVCPYTYCSLNGHHHAQLPPLKHFMSARRRMLKTQKSMRQKNQSSAKTKRRDQRKDGSGQGLFPGDQPTIQEVALDIVAVSPPTEEVGLDYFVEIYAQAREDRGDDGGIVEESDGNDVENLSEKSPHSETSCEENLDRDYLVMETDISMMSSEHSSILEDVADLKGCEAISPADSDDDEMMFEAIDMEWEEGKVVDVYLAYEAAHSTPTDDESDLKSAQGLADDEITGKYTEEVLPNEELQVQGEDNTSPDAFEYDEEDDSSKIDLPCEESGEAYQKKDEAPEHEDFTSTAASIDSSKHSLNELTGIPEEMDAVPQPEDYLHQKEILLQDENLACAINVEYDTQMEEKEGGETRDLSMSSFLSFEDNSDSELIKLKPVMESKADNEKTQTEDQSEIDETEAFVATSDSDQELPENHCIRNKYTRSKRTMHDCEEEQREFNPRGPNFLPVVPDPEAEKVDLRHQMTDERKNAEEWMIDFALQQAVNKLAPARKRRVALLVEAFEAVNPVAKFESPIHTPTAFMQTRFIQACS